MTNLDEFMRNVALEAKKVSADYDATKTKPSVGFEDAINLTVIGAKMEMLALLLRAYNDARGL